jgi:hypothetical protein
MGLPKGAWSNLNMDEESKRALEALEKIASQLERIADKLWK